MGGQVSAAYGGAGLILESSGKVGLGGVKRGHEGEDDAGEDGHGEIEKENAKIGRAGNIHSSGIGGQIDFHEGAVGPKSEGETGKSAEGGEGKALDQKLADDAQTRGAHGEADSDFLDTARTAHEHEIGKVGASDEQNGAGGGHQDPERS